MTDPHREMSEDDRFYLQAHRFALGAASIHLLVCAGLAALTQTWLLVMVVGMPAVVVPAWLVLRYPGALLSRMAMGVGFMILTSLAIQQSGGDLEAHFSFFVMLSILVVYYDWRPIVVALVVILLQHAIFTILQPLSLGFHVWNDQRNGWGHTAVHVFVGALQAGALMYLTRMLNSRRQLALENAALDRSLRHISKEASQDALTGLFNRRYLDGLVHELSASVEADGARIALCVIDIDRFKGINDRFGHPAGDEVLKSIAQSLQTTLEGRDKAIRLGGEEFLVVFYGKSLTDGVLAAEMLRKRIASAPVVTKDGSIPVTASFGVAAWRTGESFHDCYVRMDRALYLAKTSGRDLVRSEKDIDWSGSAMTLIAAA